MKITYLIISLFLISIIYNCAPSKEMVVNRNRTYQSNEISSFHQGLSVSIGWIPYQEQEMVRTSKNEWKMKRTDKEDGASMPVIVISHPESQDTTIINMTIENELLGKLIKHSLMTQQEISRPFYEFLENAKCESCHPAHIKIPFN